MEKITSGLDHVTANLYETELYSQHYTVLVCSHILTSYGIEFDNFEELYSETVKLYNQWQYWDDIKSPQVPWIESFKMFLKWKDYKNIRVTWSK